MKLTKDNYSKIKAEVYEKYRLEGKKLLRPIIQEFETNMSWIFTDEEIKQISKIPSGFLPLVCVVQIPKKFVPMYSEAIKKDLRYIGEVRKSYNKDFLEITLDKKIQVPNSRVIKCSCNRDQVEVIKDCSSVLKEYMEFSFKADEINNILKIAENSFKTLKSLKQGLVGIEKLAPKSIGELEGAVSSGALVLATDVSKYALGVA